MQDNTALVAQAQRYLEAACPDNDPTTIAGLLARFAQHKMEVLHGRDFAISLQQHIWNHVLPSLGCNPLRGVDRASPNSALLSQPDVLRFMRQQGKESEYAAACRGEATGDVVTKWQEALAEAVEEATQPGLMEAKARQGFLNMILACEGTGDSAGLELSTAKLQNIVQLLNQLEDYPNATTNHAVTESKDVEIASLKSRISDLEKAVAGLPQEPSHRRVVEQQRVILQAADEETDQEPEDPYPFGTASGSYRRSTLPRRV